MSEATAGLPSKLVISVYAAVSALGATVKPRLASPIGEPEDQMRGPLEVLLASVADVVDTLARQKGSGPFTQLASDWRELLFPDATDAEFADEYAQAVTFALLLVLSVGVSFDGRSIASIAAALGRHHSLMGKALGVLTDETIGALTVTLDTLVRVISVVDFKKFPSTKPAPTPRSTTRSWRPTTTSSASSPAATTRPHPRGTRCRSRW